MTALPGYFQSMQHLLYINFLSKKKGQIVRCTKSARRQAGNYGACPPKL
jgi:hypothetical protein